MAPNSRRRGSRNRRGELRGSRATAVGLARKRCGACDDCHDIALTGFVCFVLFVVNEVPFLTTKDTLAAVRRTANLASQPAVGSAEHGDVTGQAKG